MVAPVTTTSMVVCSRNESASSLTGVVGGIADSPNKERAQYYAQNATYSYYNVGATADAEI